ncbi:MAG: nitrous oxide reductase accessory protein NosL, partial [Deltaproteobacteria bacterium]
MKYLAMLLLACCLFVPGNLARATEQVESPRSCQQCGMDRAAYAYSRVLLTYDDGTTVGLCSIHCVVEDMLQHAAKKLTSFMVADYGTRKLIDGQKAFWVLGGDVSGVMTTYPEWAFALKKDASKFMTEHGGELASDEQALQAARKGHEGGVGMAPHQHGPAGQMEFNPAFGEDIYHTHPPGMWMLNYKFMRMSMDGLRDGTSDVPTSSVGNNRGLPYDDYMVIPTSMTMDMHMFMVMYGITDRLTVMGMLNYLENKMDMLMDMSPKKMQNGMLVDRDPSDSGITQMPTMCTRGLGDTELRAMYRFNETMISSLGLSLPTGDIDQTYVGMRNSVHRAPYDMQLGSGTFDLKPALTLNYLSDDSMWNWGGQVMATIRLGHNDNGYSLGNSLKLNAWLQRVLGPTTVWTRLSFSDTGRINGHDDEIQKLIDDHFS